MKMTRNLKIQKYKFKLRGKKIQRRKHCVENVRNKHKDAYKPWSSELTRQLEYLCCDGLEIKELRTILAEQLAQLDQEFLN